MHSALPIVMSLCAVVGGYLGWRFASKSLYRRSMHHEALESRRDHQRRVIARRKVRRLLFTAVGASVGAIGRARQSDRRPTLAESGTLAYGVPAGASAEAVAGPDERAAL
jgi:hypothetical protein